MRATTLFLIFFSLFASISCEKSKGRKDQDKKTPEKTETSLTEKVTKEITSIWDDEDSARTDSVRIENFITKNPQFEPFRKKMYKFYSRRDYELAWYDVDGEFLPQASMFINILRNVDKEGLDPAKFNVPELEKIHHETQSMFNSREKRKTLIHDLDLRLSATYFMYSRELWKGVVHPQEENLRWHIERKKIKFGKTLDSILSTGSESNPFRMYEPLHQEYHDLKEALTRYKRIKEKGGWDKLQYNSLLRQGDTSKQVVKIKKRLAAEGYLIKNFNDSVYSSDLTVAIRLFQNAHGLKQDGILGPNTVKYLNISIDEKIRQMEINLERWRWVPEKIGKDYIMVNIPEFRLRVYEKEKEVIEMKVIVGKEITHTPIFNDNLEYIVINPYWNLPKSISVEEILPVLKRNPAFLESQNMELFQNWDFDKPLNPHGIDWNKVTAENFQFQIRQKPGPLNALGTIKFLFPNNFQVYLHDTPQKYLFTLEERSFSHGCIRIEKPIELAEYILRNNKRWSSRRIRSSIPGENTYITLSKEEQLPVYILYFTVWVDKNGTVHFLDDIYGHDKKLEHVYFREKAS